MLSEITKRYLESHRHYHTLEHITRMFMDARRFNVDLTEEQVWAIWLHDLVYEPGADDNEERSAEEGLKLLGRYGIYSGPGATRDLGAIERIILDTKDHVARHEQSATVIDLDLLGFADSWNSYLNAASRIRAEFGVRNPYDPNWLKGRIEFLKGMMNRDPFFLTESFSHLEIKAKANISHELEVLGDLLQRNEGSE